MLYNNACKCAIITVQTVTPGVVTFPVSWVSDLSNIHSESFRKAKISLENILVQAYYNILSKKPIAVQVVSFSYAKFTYTSLLLLFQT